MPEGHSIRHLATVLSYGFVGTQIESSSPQGRFSAEAAELNNRTMTNTSAHGKHLFLHFDEDVVHIHLGLYGWFNLRKQKMQSAKDSTRLRISNSEYVADLSGPTKCELIGASRVSEIIAKLGPDPIHEGADRELAWSQISKSKKTIGGLLMNQAVVAGIGNVYRAELLFRARLSPFVLGKEVPREKFDEIWEDSVILLRDGSRDGKIRTVNEHHLAAHGVALHGCTHYSYVYKRQNNACLLCNDTIMSDTLDGRTVYWCPTCQK